MDIPSALRARASRCDLKRWERRELGQELRRLGLSYQEIGRVIPVAKGTLSGWCRDIDLTEAQRAHLIARSSAPRALHLGAKKNRQLREEAVERIKKAAKKEVHTLAQSSLWVAGLMLYWAEGSKTKHVCVTNSDPQLMQVMMRWFRESLGLTDDRFTLRLHLHSGQDEKDTKEFWARVTNLSPCQFGKTFWKQEGTGHRKRVLYRGTLQIVVRRSGDLLHRVMTWIDACYHSGGPLAKLVIATDS